jgi:OOP family OmpA-OmpF porin
MKHLLRKTLALTAACVAVGAHAEGLYVGGALTAPDYHDSINGYGDGKGGTGPGFKLYGGWQYHPNFGVEANVFNLGRTNGGIGGDARVWGIGVDAVGRYELSPGWWAMASAGVAQARFKTPAGNDNGPGLKLGLGLQYDLSRTTSIRVGYDQYKFNDVYSVKPTVGQTTLGMNLAF